VSFFYRSLCSGLAGLFVAALAFSATTAFSADIMRVDGAPVISTKAEAAVFWRAAADARNTTTITFTPLPASALKALQEENSDSKAKILKIGVTRDANTGIDAMTPFALNWKNVGDGHIARLAITSPGARGMRAALRLLRVLPDNAELRFSGSAEPERIIGVVSGEQANALRDDNKVYWTPITEGETQNIEIYLPSNASPKEARIRLNAISHLFTAAQDGFNAALVTKASQSCEVNVACKFDSLGAAFKNASSAVARMAFQISGGTGYCTGTLLNNTSGAQIPYFWSAAHCISTQASASTLNTYWFYEAASCNGSQLNANYTQLLGGATLLHAKTSTDTLLLRLNSTPPTGAYLVGWDASRFSSGAITGIHHPYADIKKVSLGKGEGKTCDTVLPPDPDVNNANLTLVSWSEGSTEVGSSGSGLFTVSNGQYYLRGGLEGGYASCSTTGASVNSGNADCYSSLSLVYDDVKQWLAPSSTPTQPGPTRQYTGQWIKVDGNGNNDENAWGLTVLLNFPGNARYIFVPWYTYDSTGKASWYIFQGDVWSANDVFSADVYRYSGPSWGVFPYNNSRVAPAKVGTATLTFTSATRATFTYNVEGSSRTINLAKLE